MLLINFIEEKPVPNVYLCEKLKEYALRQL